MCTHNPPAFWGKSILHILLYYRGTSIKSRQQNETGKSEQDIENQN